jgi:OOP family OmpA-OmpF porin
MVNKKYLLLAGVCTALALQPAFAQESNTASWSGRDMTYRGQSYDALDTAFVPTGRMQQQRDYLDYKYAFPAKPRNMWELGISTGFYNIIGDVTSKTPFSAVSPMDAMGFSAWLRKAIGHTVSWRVQYVYGSASGFDYRMRKTVVAGKPWTTTGGYPGGVYANYKMKSHEITAQLVAATNNISFYRAKNTVSLYGFIGGGVMMWKTMVSAAKSNGELYDFANAPDSKNLWKERKDFNTWYRDEMKNGKWTLISSPDGSWMHSGDYEVSPVLTGGVGLQFKLGSRVSLQIEDKITYAGADGMDAIIRDPNPTGGLSADKDLNNYFSVGLGFNLGNAKKTVQPLWWVNPMDHIYNELATPRHMRLPDPVLPDSDGDGVTDQFDKCPDTPAGVAVDSHGCPLDTDGDGVPDYKDKQLITPTECQPVDADGVGKCPEPECCKHMSPVSACSGIMSGSLSFGKNSAKLSATDQAQLANLAAQMRSNPDCKVVVTGNGGTSKVMRQRSWDRVNAIINYMSEAQNISRDRFIFQYEGGYGDVNSVMYRVAAPGEEGPSNLPPPHPQLGTK